MDLDKNIIRKICLYWCVLYVVKFFALSCITEWTTCIKVTSINFDTKINIIFFYTYDRPLMKNADRFFLRVYIFASIIVMSRFLYAGCIKSHVHLLLKVQVCIFALDIRNLLIGQMLGKARRYLILLKQFSSKNKKNMGTK